MSECKNDKSGKPTSYGIGVFRFKDQGYPQDFEVSALSNAPDGLPSGGVFEITVSCISDGKNKMTDYSYGNSEVGGEKANAEFLDLPAFGKTKYISFMHNGFQYKIGEYIYISQSDKSNEGNLRQRYAREFDKIVSSFKFVK